MVEVDEFETDDPALRVGDATVSYRQLLGAARLTAGWLRDRGVAPDDRIALILPNVPAAVANYLPYRIAGNLLFLAGQGPRGADGSFMTGKVGGEVSVEEGHKRARIIGLQLLSAMKMALGSLDRVDTVLKMLCMVNAVPDFKDHPKVADGMSNLFVEVFGENGRHARSAVGMGSLPNQISVEIEGVISIKA